MKGIKDIDVLEMIEEMAKMQCELDNALLQKGRELRKIEHYDFHKAKMALIDELGELTHELKANWCWWKATQKEIDENKVLEELVDAWHFALSISNNYRERNNKLEMGRVEIVLKEATHLYTYSLPMIIEFIITTNGRLTNMYALTKKLGFTMEEVYSEYKRKNEINYQRIQGGY